MGSKVSKRPKIAKILNKWEEILLVMGYCHIQSAEYKRFPVIIYETIFKHYFLSKHNPNHSDIQLGKPTIIGAVGLENFDQSRRTSFINAVIQCFSNTPNISHYFSSSKFKANFEAIYYLNFRFG